MLNKGLVAGIHASIILACVILLEWKFGYTTALFIILIGLGGLLICYIVSCAIKLRYIHWLDVLMAFCCIAIWIAILFTVDAWSRLSGQDALVYLFFGFFALVFLVCLLIINLVVFIIRWIKMVY